MKRLIAFMLALVLFSVAAVPAARAASDYEQTEYLEDGSYIVVGLQEDVEHTEEAEVSFIGRLIEVIKRLINMLLGKSNDKTARDEKYLHYYDKNGTKLWSVYLTGKFSYNGKEVSCTDADVRYYLYDGDWEMLYCNAEKNGATAKASFKVRQYKLGVPLKTIEKSITLTCDKDGRIK